jgi:5-deoxy-glucuronate isomerase
MNLLRKAAPLKAGYTAIMGPEDYPLKYAKFGRLLLDRGLDCYEENTGADEIAVNIFSGRCDIRVDGEPVWANLGARDSMLQGFPTMAYFPRNRKWSVKLVSHSVDIGIYRANARRDTKPVLVTPNMVRVQNVGVGVWERNVVSAIHLGIDADRLLAGECYTNPGTWASYPPHKHDTNTPPKEAWAEEIYHFVVEPKEGFGIQRIYTEPGNSEPIQEIYVIESVFSEC